MNLSLILRLGLVCCASLSLLQCSHEAFAPSEFSAFSNADDASLSDSLRQAYYEDAARLALRELGRTRDLAEAPVELPDELVQTFYSALLLVHNAVDLPARKAVVEDYAIHTFYPPELHSLIISADTAAAWFKALRRGERVTGEVQVDQLLQQYELYPHAQSYAFDFVELYTKRPLNLAALAKQFAGIGGMRYAQPNVWIGSARDIEASGEERGIALRYKYGWGDCLSGCLARHYWQFFVHEDRRVEFRGEWGSPLPR